MKNSGNWVLQQRHSIMKLHLLSMNWHRFMIQPILPQTTISWLWKLWRKLHFAIILYACYMRNHLQVSMVPVNTITGLWAQIQARICWSLVIHHIPTSSSFLYWHLSWKLLMIMHHCFVCPQQFLAMTTDLVLMKHLQQSSPYSLAISWKMY